MDKLQCEQNCIHCAVCGHKEQFKKYFEEHISLREKSVLFDEQPKCDFYINRDDVYVLGNWKRRNEKDNGLLNNDAGCILDGNKKRRLDELKRQLNDVDENTITKDELSGEALVEQLKDEAKYYKQKRENIEKARIEKSKYNNDRYCALVNKIEELNKSLDEDKEEERTVTIDEDCDFENTKSNINNVIKKVVKDTDDLLERYRQGFNSTIINYEDLQEFLEVHTIKPIIIGFKHK
jgi:hypothetical protein